MVDSIRASNIILLANLCSSLAEDLRRREIFESPFSFPKNTTSLAVFDVVLSGTDSLLSGKSSFGESCSWDCSLHVERSIRDIGHECHRDPDCHVKLLLDELVGIASKSELSSSFAACCFVLGVPCLSRLLDAIQESVPRSLYCLFSSYSDWLLWLDDPFLGDFVEFCAANGVTFTPVFSNSFKKEIRNLLSSSHLGYVGSCFVVASANNQEFRQVVSYLRGYLMNAIRSLTGGPCVDELMMLKHSCLNFVDENHNRSCMLLQKPDSYLSDPFVVVGSGGSLDKNLDLVKSLQPMAWIVSAGSSIGALLREGVVPDFHVHVERGWDDSVANCYSNVFSSLGFDKLKSTIAVVPSSIHPSINDLYGRSIFYSRQGQSPLFALPFLRDSCLRYEGPQCLSAAFAFVMHLNPKQVFLVGADLGASAPDLPRSLYAVGHSDRSFDLVVPGNFSSRVHTSRDMLFQASFMESAINSTSCRPNVLNLSDGIRLRFASPCSRERVKDCLSSELSIIDKQEGLDGLLDHCSVALDCSTENQINPLLMVKEQLLASRSWLFKWSFLAKQANHLDPRDLRVEASRLLDVSFVGDNLLAHRIFRGSVRDGFWLTARCVERHMQTDSESKECWKSFSRFIDSLVFELNYFEASIGLESQEFEVAPTQ